MIVAEAAGQRIAAAGDGVVAPENLGSRRSI
jgi:hypothetical protein